MTEKLDAIEIFIATVETGSLSGAARKTGLSISTISRQLTSLENRLKVKLLIRSTRKIALTEEGNAYYTSVKEVFNNLHQLEEQLTQQKNDPIGRLHISAPTLFGRHYLIPILSDFMVLYPKIDLEITLLDRNVDLLEEGIDLAIKIGDLEDSSLICRTLGHIQWIACASPLYLKKYGIPKTPYELEKHQCLVYKSATNNEWPFLDKGRKIKIKVPVKMKSNTLDAVVSGAIKGVGITLTPAWFVRDRIQNHELAPLLEGYQMEPRPIQALFTHNHLLTNKVRLLLDYLVKNLKISEFN